MGNLQQEGKNIKSKRQLASWSSIHVLSDIEPERVDDESNAETAGSYNIEGNAGMPRQISEEKQSSPTFAPRRVQCTTKLVKGTATIYTY